jgi:hypothetical protein
MLWLRIIDVFHHSGLSGGSKRGELVLGRGPDGDRGRAAPPLRGKTRLWPTRAGVRRPRAGPCRLGPVVAGTRMARFHRLYMLFQPGTMGWLSPRAGNGANVHLMRLPAARRRPRRRCSGRNRRASGVILSYYVNYCWNGCGACRLGTLHRSVILLGMCPDLCDSGDKVDSQ